MATAMLNRPRRANSNGATVRKGKQEGYLKDKPAKLFASYKTFNKVTKKNELTFKGVERYFAYRDQLIDMCRQAYKEQNWKVRSLSLWSGVSPETIRGVLDKKRRFPRLDTLWKIAESMEVDIAPAKTV